MDTPFFDFVLWLAFTVGSIVVACVIALGLVRVFNALSSETRWEDQSGNGNHATQSIRKHRPRTF